MFSYNISTLRSALCSVSRNITRLNAAPTIHILALTTTLEIFGNVDYFKLIQIF